MSSVDVLAVFAHPDDLELSVGGTMLKLKGLGYRTGALDVTRGEMGTRGTVEGRAQEAEEAAKILKLDVRENLGLADGHVFLNEESRIAMVRAFRRLKPKVVLTQQIGDSHPDHNNIAQLVRDCMRLCAMKNFDPETGDEKIKPPIVAHDVFSRTVVPSFIIDISDFLDEKVEAIRAHRSQFYDPNSAEPETMLTAKGYIDAIANRSRYYGSLIGVAAGEPFYVRGIECSGSIRVAHATDESLLLMSELTPEEIELSKKRGIVERLADRLADREEEMADLREELERFEARYSMDVGRLYAEQDEIDAQIAEEELKLVPDDEEIKQRVEELRRLAEESAARAAEAEKHAAEKWEPSAEARKAYHDLARIIHPDLALDSNEKERRHGLMAELNQAYSSGDQSKLKKLSEELRLSPEVVQGGSVGDELVRAIRQIAQMRKRFNDLEMEKAAAESSELYELFQKGEAEFGEGRDLLKHMAERAKTHIKKSERRLENLRNVTAAQEEHVKEAFGLNIEDFRKV